jgi:hypothetical protein
VADAATVGEGGAEAGAGVDGAGVDVGAPVGETLAAGADGGAVAGVEPQAALMTATVAAATASRLSPRPAPIATSSSIARHASAQDNSPAGHVVASRLYAARAPDHLPPHTMRGGLKR